jgi:hypothetical protein
MASNESDHCPLLLGLKDNLPGTRCFHFEAFWLKLEGFQDVVSLGWNSMQALACPFATLDAKIKSITKGLQNWSDKNVGYINFQLALAWEVLHRLEIANDNRNLSEKETWFKNNLKKHSLALTSLKWTIAKLCSHIGWLREGDANTKLFHLHSCHWKRKNFIAKLVSDDQVYTKHEEKAHLVDLYYEEVLGTSANREHTINLNELGVPMFDLSDLDSPFSEEEAWATIKGLPADKVLGPDGLTGRFHKSCWPIIK